MEDYPFIIEIEGDQYLEPEKYEDRKVELTEIFELYSSPDIEADEVARYVGIDESDVLNAVFYWTEEEGVYEELVKKANLGPESEGLSSEHDVFEEEFSGGESVPEPFDPLQTAVSKFMEFRHKDQTNISEQNIVDFPDESVFGESFNESKISWTRSGDKLEVYAGWDGSSKGDVAVLSYSVDGEMGETLEVDIEDVEDKVLEMYRNAVFTSMQN